MQDFDYAAVRRAVFAAMNKRGWSPQDAADACGVTIGTIRNLLFHNKRTQMMKLSQISDGFGWGVDGLLRLGNGEADPRDFVVPNDGQVVTKRAKVL
ncbi:MAG TPA: hypothetical protein VIL77_14365 [Gaiellaceae bacterium]